MSALASLIHNSRIWSGICVLFWGSIFGRSIVKLKQRAMAVMIVAVPIAVLFSRIESWDFWNLPRLHSEIAESERLSDEMDLKGAVVRQRIEVKNQLTNEVVAGRL